jgi:hypothetical protein
MMAVLAITAAALASQAVPEALVDAVEAVESSGRGAKTPTGDSGKAIGPFQFHRESWADCSAVRKKAGLRVWPYSSAADPVRSREYARTWLTVLRIRLMKDIGRTPFPGEIWLAYNLGYDGFKEYRFQWGLVPLRRFEKARKVNALTHGKL